MSNAEQWSYESEPSAKPVEIGLAQASQDVVNMVYDASGAAIPQFSVADGTLKAKPEGENSGVVRPGVTPSEPSTSKADDSLVAAKKSTFPVLVPGSPFRYIGYEYYMSSVTEEPEGLTIRARKIEPKDIAGVVVSYSYDGSGNLTKIVNPANPLDDQHM